MNETKQKTKPSGTTRNGVTAHAPPSAAHAATDPVAARTTERVPPAEIETVHRLPDEDLAPLRLAIAAQEIAAAKLDAAQARLETAQAAKRDADRVRTDVQVSIETKHHIAGMSLNLATGVLTRSGGAP